jgi:uncharacterized protein YfaS (alpha-2-macroglobulin family)
MATSTYETGNTVKFTATIKDFDNTTLIDPAIVTVTLYTSDEDIITTGSPIRVSTGVYYYDWTLPSVAGTYYIEFKGVVGGEPSLQRTPVKVKFNT